MPRTDIREATSAERLVDMPVTTSEGDIVVGDVVRILSADTYSWGIDGVTPNDIGIVRAITGHTYHIAIAHKDDNWFCKRTDIELAHGVTDIEVKDRLTDLVEDYNELHKKHPEIYDKRITDINNDISRLERELLTHTKQLRDVIKLKECDVRRARTIKSNASIRGMFDYLLANCYESISIRSTTTQHIEAITKPLIIDRYDYKFELGRFKIRVEFDSILITNYDGKQVERHIHPHLSGLVGSTDSEDSNETICWGSYNTKIREHIASYDYLLVLDVVHKFLSDVNLESQYIDIREWYPDADKRCTKCWNLLDKCTCKLCTHCGEDEDNCSCEHCPDTGDFLSDGVCPEYCSECGSYDRDEGCQY